MPVLASFAPSLLSCRFHCTKKSVTMDAGCQAAPLLLWDAGLSSPLCSCLFSKEAEDLGPVDHLTLQLVSGCVHFLLPSVVSRAPRPQPSALPSSSLTGCLPSACTSIDFSAFTASPSVPPSHQNLETHRNTLRRVLLPQGSHLFLCSHFGRKAKTQFSHLLGKSGGRTRRKNWVRSHWQISLGL